MTKQTTKKETKNSPYFNVPSATVGAAAETLMISEDELHGFFRQQIERQYLCKALACCQSLIKAGKLTKAPHAVAILGWPDIKKKMDHMTNTWDNELAALPNDTRIWPMTDAELANISFGVLTAELIWILKRNILVNPNKSKTSAALWVILKFRKKISLPVHMKRTLNHMLATTSKMTTAERKTWQGSENAHIRREAVDPFSSKSCPSPLLLT